MKRNRLAIEKNPHPQHPSHLHQTIPTQGMTAYSGRPEEEADGLSLATKKAPKKKKSTREEEEEEEEEVGDAGMHTATVVYNTSHPHTHTLATHHHPLLTPNSHTHLLVPPLSFPKHHIFPIPKTQDDLLDTAELLKFKVGGDEERPRGRGGRGGRGRGGRGGRYDGPRSGGRGRGGRGGRGASLAINDEQAFPSLG